MKTIEPECPRLKDERAAARYLFVSVSSLRRLKAAGEIPYVRTGSRGLRFDSRDLDTFIEQRKRREQPTLTTGTGVSDAAAARLQ